MEDLVLGIAKSLVEGTLSKAQSAIDEESKLRQSTQQDLVFIAGEFHMMQSFLSVTTEEHVRNNVVRSWVIQVRDLAYDVEDSIELVVHLDTKSDWLRRMIPSCMRQPLPLDEAVGIIEQLKVRVQDVNQRKERYKLISDSGGPNPVTEMVQPATTGSWFDMLAEARSTTRKQRDMDDLTNLVARTGSDRQVISVWVSGGNLGAASKSIVRKAYDNTKIWGNFSCRAWVNVNLGNPFNLKEFPRSLMDQFSDDGSIPPVTEGLEDLITKIKEKVNNETYLVVLEDLSTNVFWDTILEYLPDRGNGSRIVVLTQQFQVASLCIPPGFGPYIPCFWSDYSLCVFSEDKEGPLVGHMSEVNQISAYLAKARFNALQVISVYGIPAAGKSALVRNLYRKKMSQNNNEYKKYIWVDVHHPFNLVDFCKSILMQFHSRSLGTDEDPVQKCHGLLKDQQCLLVIDNLQSTEDWDLIHGTLAFRPSGSAIVVITNEERIALHCADRKDLVFHVKPLEAGVAIDLFKIKVEGSFISANDVETDPVLQQLIPKCGGLPKLIVALADVLGQTYNWAEEATILNDSSVLNLETRPQFSSLQGLFSWLHSYLGALPKHLSYLLIFPGDRSIRRRRLVMRWGAEGYSTDCENYTADENGEELFSRLVKETMFQRPPRTTITNTRMVSFEVNAMFREYMISRPLQQNIATAIELSALKGTCSPTSRRRGRHLVIEQSWDSDRIVFKNIDFSRLRSLTVFGKWEKFFITEGMKVLRVLDLEDASGVTNKDLQNMLKLLPRLKFLSLRGCSEINYLPSSVGELRQLQILDVRYTNIVTIPASITKLKKLQYIRAGPTAPPEDPSAPHAVALKLSELRRCLQQVGVGVISGIGELTALHTLGIINVSEAVGKVILKELSDLTQLRKLGVSGVSKKNGKEFCSAILCQSRLESLSVWLNVDNKDCLDSMLPENNETSIKLQSLKLYGPLEKLPSWIDRNKQLCNLKKLNLELDMLLENDIKVLGELQELCILRLRVKPPQDGMLHFCVVTAGVEVRCYERVKVLEIASRSSLHVTFGSEPRAMQKLELLNVGCCTNGSQLKLDGLTHLSELKEVRVIGSSDETLKTNLEGQFPDPTRKPALKLEEVVLWNQGSTGRNDQHYYSFPFYCTTR